MKKIFSLFLIIMLLEMPVMATNVKVSKNTTTILMTINEPITSKTVKEGSVLDATVSENVYVNKHLIFKEGTLAKVNVTKVKKATIMGVPGEIIIENGRVKDINGENHIVTFSYNIQGNAKLYPKVFAGVGLFLWPCLLFCLAKGEQAKIPNNYEISATLRDDFDFNL